MGVSLDGYIVGPDGDFAWTAPDEGVFRFVTDQIREVGVHLLGRRLYETMLHWETAEQNPSLGFSTLEFAALWKAFPKVSPPVSTPTCSPSKATPSPTSPLCAAWSRSGSRGGS